MKPDIVSVISGYVNLEKKGREHIGLCPFHSDTKPSLMVNGAKQVFSCFACGVGGDVYDFIKKHENISYTQALNMTQNAPKTAQVAPSRAPALVTPIPPKEVDAVKFPNSPSRFWVYHDANSGVLGFVLRYDEKDGKRFTPYVYTTEGWRSQAFAKPFPLYNLHLLEQERESKVMICEGEKAAEAAQGLFSTYKVVATTWPFGANSIDHVDWSPLANRKVILCPDNDTAGKNAMNKVATILLKLGCHVQMFDIPPDMPAKWDWADYTKPKQDAKTLLTNNLISVSNDVTGEVATKEATRSRIMDTTPFDEYFQIMGYDVTESHNFRVVFYDAQIGRILTRDADKLNASFLSILAPDRVWNNALQCGEKGYPNSKAVHIAGQLIVAIAKELGPVRQNMVRGRGIWSEGKQLVINSGQHITIGGRYAESHLTDGYIYEKSADIGLLSRQAAITHADSRLLIDAVNMVSFENELHRQLLIGWICLSPFAGVLSWRSHLWLLGEKGSGKSTILQLIRKVLGDVPIYAQGRTTEPGIRRQLGLDARPVIIDEMDAHSSPIDRERIESILTFARACSTDNSGDVFKGIQGGGGIATFATRAMFLMASVSMNMRNAADKSRFSVVQLRSIYTQTAKERENDYCKFLGIIDNITEEWQCGFIKYVKSVIDTYKIYKKQLIQEFANQDIERRHGDQLGSLIAMYYAYSKERFDVGAITTKYEMDYIATSDFMHATNILDYFLSITLQKNSNETSIGQLIAEFLRTEADVHRKTMHNYGFDVFDIENKETGRNDKYIFIANNNPNLNKLFENTEFYNYILFFKRLADVKEGQRRISGVNCRGIYFPNVIK